MLCLFIASNAGPVLRAAETNGPLPALTASAGFWADIDQDGLMDVLLTGATTNETITRLYRNNGDGTFRNLESGFAPLRSALAAWGDFDRDGHLDVAIAGIDSLGSAVTQIYRNQGNNVFMNIGARLDGVVPAIVQWVDFDNDGDEDLYVSGAWTSLYRNEGGTFHFQATRPHPLRQGMWGDFDGDGDLDLYSLGAIQRNDGDALFTLGEYPDYNAPRYGSYSADYDGDGDLDVIAVSKFGDGHPRVMQNDGTAQFVETVLQDIPLWPDVAQWGDYNGDGKLELLIAGGIGENQPVIRVYQRINDGWSLSADIAGIYYGGLNHTDWVDIDGDTDLDVFFTGPRSSKTGDFVTDFHTNVVASSIPQIGVPSNLRATAISSDEILLQWDPPQSPAFGLTYNVVVGTSSGGFDVVAPNANLATGRRWINAAGNAAIWNRHRLRLSSGRFYWRVQSINAAFLGGMFSDEATFAITNSRPVISELQNQETLVNNATPWIPFVVADAETAASNLILFADSSNPSVVPNESIAFQGSGSNRAVRFFPARDSTGQATIRITVQDPQGAESSVWFEITVIPQFSLSEVTVPTLRNPILTWGDMDGDDDLDLIAGGTNPIGYPVTVNNQTYTIYDGVLTLYRNNSLGALIDSGVPILGVIPFPVRIRGLRYGSVSLNDLEGDGDIDLLINGEYSAPYFISDIYTNAGTGIFQPLGLSYPAFQFRSYNSWEDIDNDGRPEIMMGGRLQTLIDRHLGGGTFAPLARLPGHTTGSGTWIDSDNDGNDELLLVLADYQSDIFNPPQHSHLYANDGAGNFTATEVPLPNLAWSAVAPVDYDGDGWVDFVVSGTSNYTAQASGATTELYHNEQGTSFRRVDAPFVPVYLGTFSWADYDNDSDFDLLIAGSTTNDQPVTRLYRNDGGGVFSEVNVGLPDLATPAIAWGDYDFDGDLDLAISGTATNGLFSGLFRNNHSPANSRPQAPSALQATLLPDNGISLEWPAGSDLETTNTALLTYAIRVGTNSGGQNIVASLSNPETGVRRVARAGQSHRFLRIPDLPKGEYFWSVQTIDSVFEGSGFAPEARFMVTNARPSISSLADLRTIPNTIVSNASLIVGDMETPGNDLRFTVTSSDTNLIPIGNVFFFGSGSNRTLAVLPTSLVGTASVTVTVWDSDDGKKSSTFTVRVDEFGERSPLALNMEASGMDWGDYDNDGDLDLAATGISSGVNFTRLYRNNGNGMFEEVPSAFTPSGSGKVIWSDFDHDGYLDLLATGSAGSRVFKNNGDGTFTAIQVGLPALNNSAAACFDYDGDGDNDILACGFEVGRGSVARLLRNEGRFVFTSVPTRLPGVSRGAIATADFDNDGDLDLLLSGRVDNEDGIVRAIFTMPFRNDGNSVFERVFQNLPSIARSIAVGDYDDDGDTDILLNIDNGVSESAPLYLYRNEGNWGFTEVVTGMPAINRGVVAWGDYNNDGRMDILATGRLQGAHVYQRRGDGTFSDLGLPIFGPQTFSTAAWGDYDNDGRLDFALSSGHLRLARNEMPLRSVSLLTPSNLHASLSQGGRVNMTWADAVGGELQSAPAVGYNIRVGTTSGGQEIMAGNSDSITGGRRVAQFGNAGATNSWRLVLGPGTYYWSVQAIGGSLAGSSFSGESTFTVTAPRIIHQTFNSAGDFYIRFTGLAGNTYSVESSLDLVTWTPVGTAIEIGNGSFEFAEHVESTTPRFYRVVDR